MRIWPYIEVITVQPLKDYYLLISFSDHPDRKKVYDVRKLIETTEMFAPLKDDRALFEKAYIDTGTVVWNDEMELHPDSLYKLSIPYEEWLKNNS